MSKKQILMCTVAPIFPIDSGGKLYISNTLNQLSSEYEYHLITYIGNSKDVEEIEKYSYEYKKYFKTLNYVKRPKMLHEKNKREKIIHFLIHLYYKLPLMDISFYSKEYVKLAGKIIKEYDIDFIEVHNLHTAFIKKFYSKIPTVLINQNIEGDIFPFWPPNTKNKYKKILWDYIIKKSRFYTSEIELKNMYKINVKTFISRNDLLRADAQSNRCFYLPLGFKTKKIERTLKDNIFRLTWVGGFGWYPNEQAIMWFLEEIYPILKEKINTVLDSQIEIHIVGGGVTEEIKKYSNKKDIFIHGRVEDLDSIFISTNILIAPILSGGGVKVKIVEAMSKGIPVLSTSKGIEGLMVKDGKNIIVRDSAESFSDALIYYALHPNELTSISDEAIEYVKEYHNLQKCVSTKKEVYKILMDDKKK